MTKKKKLKIALVHDYISEFGGAERVLEALAEMYPDAPIYTAFYQPGSPAYERFKNHRIKASWAQHVPLFKSKLHSPLRFLAPLIWESFNFDDYDLVISSASWYITKGIITQPETLHICYCHTPPRYLYGYETSVSQDKNLLIKIYARLVNPFMRKYDFLAAQRVDYFIANSRNVAGRIKKFYRRDSKVIYPPVSLSTKSEYRNSKKDDFYLTGGRLVAPKHFEVAIAAANQLNVPLKIYGTGPLESSLKDVAGDSVEFLGKVSEKELTQLYHQAKAFITLSEDEDFGITPVEAMMAGTPVIAFKGGGYIESVVEGETGVFVSDLNPKTLAKAIQKVDAKNFDAKKIKAHAEKFSRDRFEKEMQDFVTAKMAEFKEKSGG